MSEKFDETSAIVIQPSKGITVLVVIIVALVALLCLGIVAFSALLPMIVEEEEPVLRLLYLFSAI